MSKTANVPSINESFDGSYVPYSPDGSVNTDLTWRADDGTLMHFTSKGTAMAVVFSISASISEQFSTLIDESVREQNKGRSKEDSDSRAEVIRQWVADAVDYDLSQEPEREKGSGLVAYREKVAKATKTADALAALVASNPELAAMLQAQGIEL